MKSKRWSPDWFQDVHVAVSTLPTLELWNFSTLELLLSPFRLQTNKGNGKLTLSFFKGRLTQLVRVTDLHSVCRGFESLSAYHPSPSSQGDKNMKRAIVLIAGFFVVSIVHAGNHPAGFVKPIPSEVVQLWAGDPPGLVKNEWPK